MTDSSSKPASIFLRSNRGTSTSKTNKGTDVSIENLHDGFTHVFESTFESTEGVREYVYHPAHVEFATDFLGSTEKVLIIDFKPAAGN
ncbi:hypothetical protein TRIUR3_11709 [Triticum urartu]|uniref:Stress-response A/B barrel domain-containing protein n=2 Tax=Triticum TaxID=4564 RepID=A0A9R1R1A0_TRITD|nr:hypothetical protein TRIUR3_11709 [Triticum urartu]VAH24863.1 unnamed protein product [Triticum turgidum subsp. durum]